jgi:glycosyltransferase involved in cell wall biosynthesis
VRIAQIAPLIEPVPPKLYGGTERVVSYVTEELVRLGHHVTLFASGDSQTSAELVACCEESLRLNPQVRDPLAYNVLMLERVRQRAGEFDVLHFHTDYMFFPLIRDHRLPSVTTLHGRLDLPDLITLYGEFDDIPLVSISHHQRLPLPPVNWAGTVYHGLPLDLYPFCENPSRDYLAFLGRVSPEKRPDRAIAIAWRARTKLKMASKVDKVDQDYFNTDIKPLLQQHASCVEFFGEIELDQRRALLGNALALIFPIDWPEPFGLVMIEAMSCGTPVIAYQCGSVPEVVEDGVTGFIVSDETEAVAAVKRVRTLDRRTIRKRFEERFSVHRMVHDYLDLYRAAPRPQAIGQGRMGEPAL